MSISNTSIVSNVGNIHSKDGHNNVGHYSKDLNLSVNQDDQSSKNLGNQAADATRDQLQTPNQAAVTQTVRQMYEIQPPKPDDSDTDSSDGKPRRRES